MATRPLPQAAAGPRFAPYIEELHEFFATNRVLFGSPADLAPVTERLRARGPFSDDLSSLVRSFILRQGGAMPHAQLLEILTLAIAGPEAVDAPQRYSEPIRQLLAFVAGVMRHPWNVPPGQRPDAETLPFPGEAFAPAPEAIPEPIAGIIAPPPATPTPIHPTPVQPTPLPPTVPEPTPPFSAIAAALAESKRMSLRPEPEPRPDRLPEPVLFLRAADIPRPEPEPDLDPTFDAGLDRPSPVFRNVLIGAALTAALALFFVYSGRKSADILRIHPLADTYAAFAHLEAIAHRPSAPQPSAEHPPATPSPTAPSRQTENLPPAPQPATAQPPSTQSPAAASTQPAPVAQFVAGTSRPPGPSAHGEPRTPRPGHHSRDSRAPLVWTYPEATYPEAPHPETPFPKTNPPDSAAALPTPAPAAPAPAVPAAPAPSSTQPQTTTSPVYVPYTPSSKDRRYAPYTPGGDATQPAAPVVRQPPPQP